ncbi:MAG: hypothetical protein EOO47_00100 [Flavobacterium sp.]|nr:MAG: hypothetical protein EOO47_00100 [Flavobacterium sp.]
MTDTKYQSIKNNLNVAQAMMLALGIGKEEIFLTIIDTNPFDIEDEDYFEKIVDDLIKLCIQNEQYEVCAYLKTIKDNIR